METSAPPPELSGHVVICNCNEKVGHVVDELQAAELCEAVDVVLVSHKLGLWDAHPEWHPARDGPGRFYQLAGHPTDEAVLVRAGVDRARAVVILADPEQGRLADARSTLVALAIEKRNPAAHTVMELISSINREHLRGTLVNEVICLGEIEEKLIAQSCITPGVTNVFERLLTSAPGRNRILMAPLPEALAGLSYHEVARRAIERRAPFVVCGFLRPSAREHATPLPDQRLAAVGGRVPGAGGAADAGLVLNPRRGVEPGRATALAPGDQLILLGFDPGGLPSALAALAAPAAAAVKAP